MNAYVFPCLDLLTGFRPGDGSPSETVHRCAARDTWRRHGAWGRLRVLAAFALWPGVAVAGIAWYTARNGPAIRHRTGKGLARQVAEQFAVLRHSVTPRRYYVFGLYDDAKRARARHYLHPVGAQQGVFKLLNRVLGGDTVALKNKVRFGRRCRERDLAAIETIAVVVKGAVQTLGSVRAAAPRRRPARRRLAPSRPRRCHCSRRLDAQRPLSRSDRPGRSRRELPCPPRRGA